MTRKILQPNGLFATPQSFDELIGWIERLPAHDGTRTAALTAAMMAWNLAAELTSQPDSKRTDGAV